ncbi:MAG TPA: Crp/Fnr family transcriptional regulator [Candidatus Faecousia intestinavium]|nr:Crp/Fnr family transcriptional regulator [Candidatus Faecousia intestinavium]
MDLTQTSLFSGISQADLSALLSCLAAVERRYSKGAVILAEGEPTQWMGLVLEGRAIISCADVWGKSSILGFAEPGAVFGEAYACVPGEALLISVCAAEETRVLFLNVGKLLTVCGNACPFHARLIRNLLSISAGKNLQLSRRIFHTTPKSIRGRLQSYFSECAKKSGSLTFKLPFNRQQLADYLGVDRSAMSSELSKMQRDGLIQVQGGTITMLPQP